MSKLKSKVEKAEQIAIDEFLCIFALQTLNREKCGKSNIGVDIGAGAEAFLEK